MNRDTLAPNPIDFKTLDIVLDGKVIHYNVEAKEWEDPPKVTPQEFLIYSMIFFLSVSGVCVWIFIISRIGKKIGWW